MGTASTSSQTICGIHWDESGGFMASSTLQEGGRARSLLILPGQEDSALLESIASFNDPLDPRRDRDPREPVDSPKRDEPWNDPDESPLDRPPVDDPDDSPGEGEPARRDPDPKEPARLT
jgi:hypothetical protein